MLKQNIHPKKLGAITVEVAVGIALAVVVLIVAIGLFNENLSAMIINSKIGNMFNNKDKTTYSSSNIDYSGSQINVQLIGEQGLAMLRRIANNKAITQIDKLMDGTDTSVTNLDSIGYLVTAINAIVGSPDICVYMKKDSDKKCDQDGIGGVAYYVSLSGGSVSVNKVGTLGTKGGAFSGDFISAASGVTITPSRGNSSAPISPISSGYSPTNISTTSIYKYIKDLSAAAEQSNTVYDYVLLIKAINAGTSPNNVSLTAIIGSISDLFNNSDPTKGLVASINLAHNACADTSWDTGWGTVDESNGNSGCGDSLTSVYPGSNSYVSVDEMNRVQNYANSLISAINNAKSTAEVENLLNTLLSNQDFIFVLENDHINSPTSCQVFTTGINSIISAYGLSISPPACTPL